MNDHAFRQLDAPGLAAALRHSRQRTLALADAWGQALPGLQVPYTPELNPPLWELGHVGWFQEWWVGRNPQRPLGTACEPDHARPASALARADTLYNSSQVPHASRWHLPLPSLADTHDYLAAVLEQTLALLAQAGPSDSDLYFWRLVLAHEDMHNEASVYMAQALNVPLPPGLAWGHDQGHAQPRAVDQGPVSQPAQIPAQTVTLGHQGPGFAFDNELGAHTVAVAAFDIDTAPISWARYLPFVQATGHRLPLHVRRVDGQWQSRHFGQWQPLDDTAPAVHLSHTDALAWCRWAGRRLPTEAEWVCAAQAMPHFSCGGVWEWTASAFAPFPGFAPHPYRDYSAPWFDGRPVLKGFCAASAYRMAHICYRNYFTPERRDIFAGFRSAGPARG
jgi:gamma-glutamyl hercynylcysteine S-oxide synthase